MKVMSLKQIKIDNAFDILIKAILRYQKKILM